jgi:DNA-binding GntR family transcriptional regulator
MTPAERFAALSQSPPLRDQVYDALESLIIDGVLTPGQRLTEGDLAERLGVSRNPVREALNALSRAGWVELRPRQGAYVRLQSVEEVDQFFHVRGLLEVESARLAAQRATPEMVASLRALLADGDKALEAGDEAALLTANSAFHAEMVIVSGNRVLGEILGLLDKRLRWYFAPVVVERGPHSWAEHSALVDAIAANDVEQAAERMRQHTEATRAAYLRRRGLDA